ncbi:MAG TPA: transposase [Pseudonocardiaceae bacterium]|nr:transposase [Pseudonocardiaceae bacterium]
MDSQSVKAADTVGAASRGFDAGKKINDRKRHLAVDVEGLLLAVVVTAANVGDRAGAKLLVIAVLNVCTRLKLIWADSGYDGAPLAGWVRAVTGITLRVIKRTELHTFQVVPRRWVVERSFGCCCGIGGWCATTNAVLSITRRWSTGPVGFQKSVTGADQ